MKRHTVKIKGQAKFSILDKFGQLRKTLKVKNIIVNGLLNNIITTLSAATTGNSIANYKYIALGSSNTAETVNDVALGTEHSVSTFGTSGGNNIYATRLTNYTATDLSTNTYTVSASVVNLAAGAVSIAESGIFAVDTVGATGNMGSHTTIATPLSLQNAETLKCVWTWTISSS
jgi:hypothetical protein